MRAHEVSSVQGNHDAWVSKRYREGLAENNILTEDRAGVDHNISVLNEADIAYLEPLPEMFAFSADGYDYALTHL